MTPEEKQLLIKDLCSRLPYGFIIHRYSDNRNITFNPNEIDDFANFLEFKPYLRPMSSMTEEEAEEFYNLPFCDEQGYQRTDWLNTHHFDYRGLIPMGLALEAPEGMYKTE